jgi:hypothetical protein
MNDEKLIWEAYEKKKPKKLSAAFIEKQARLFFSQKDDKASELISNCKNTSEMEYRLTWLSEGSLKYHLMRMQTPYMGPQGDPVEKELYNQFQQHLEQFVGRKRC